MSEAERLAKMYARIDPDGPLDPEVEQLIAKAAEIAGVPMATLNLLDSVHQCSLGAVGFEGQKTPRSEAMCNITLDEGAFVVVPDAHDDPRFSQNPWVDGRRADVSFYASFPLLTHDNYAIGTLCVFDTKPHELTAIQALRLLGLASEVVSTLERNRHVTVPEVHHIGLSELTDFGRVC